MDLAAFAGPDVSRQLFRTKYRLRIVAIQWRPLKTGLSTLFLTRWGRLSRERVYTFPKIAR